MCFDKYFDWDEEVEYIKNKSRKETLEELISKAEGFGGILPIRVIRNMLKECEDEV